jgi:hypothetical protein
MGFQRQTVQPPVDALAADGLVELVENPNHRRAKLIRAMVLAATTMPRELQRRLQAS